MLNDPSPLHRPAPSARWQPLVHAWLPSTRALPTRTLGAVALVAMAPALYTALRGGKDFGGALTTAALVLGTCTAFALDDSAEETLAASPTSLARRRGLRLSAIAAGVAIVGALAVGLAHGSDDTTAVELGRRAAELAAVAGVAAAVAGLSQRAGLAGAVHGGAAAGLLVVLFVSGLALRYHQLPSLSEPFHHERWWWIAAAGGALTGWSWRDPARR